MSIALPTLRTWLDKWFARRRDSFPEPIDGSHVLAKAAGDYWEYAIGLKSGLIVHCSHVKLQGDWIVLQGIQRVENAAGQSPLLGNFWWGRGMEVRISEIAFAADCDS
jgi:hypothetical protein